MLKNQLYRGEIVHKDHVYPGEHQAIIDGTFWGAVQTRLARRAHRFNYQLVQGRARRFGDLARGETLHRFYLTQLLCLA